jgi:hypothetical protein
VPVFGLFLVLWVAAWVSLVLRLPTVFFSRARCETSIETADLMCEILIQAIAPPSFTNRPVDLVLFGAPEKQPIGILSTSSK